MNEWTTTAWTDYWQCQPTNLTTTTKIKHLNINEYNKNNIEKGVYIGDNPLYNTIDSGLSCLLENLYRRIRFWTGALEQVKIQFHLTISIHSTFVCHFWRLQVQSSYTFSKILFNENLTFNKHITIICLYFYKNYLIV